MSVHITRFLLGMVTGLILFPACPFVCRAGVSSPQDTAVVSAGYVKDRVMELSARADSLRLEYRFSASAAACREAIRLIGSRYSPEMVVDSIAGMAPEDSVMVVELEEKRVMAGNGFYMTDYVSEPVVVSKHRFSSEDFFLFYPLQDKSWRMLPNCLDSDTTHPYAKAVYVPEGSTDIYFSAPDENGVRNIYRTSLRDSLWTKPELLHEDMTSSGDEIYPMLSPDKKTLYFASAGLYGVGGYDLYESKWDEEQNSWGVPVNMGFPYSSPYDDFLYINTSDGKYTLFASNRECGRDSVMLYVLEYDNMPVRRKVEEPEDVKEICALIPVNDPSRMDTGSTVQSDIPENVDTKRYMDKIAEVRALRDSVFIYTQAIERGRESLAESTDEQEKARISADVERMELRVPVFQEMLDEATGVLQKIEMEFLFSGVVIDPDKVANQADREVVGASTNYAFTRLSPGDTLRLDFEKPEVRFDYSFMILPEGRFAEDNSLPDGIVYQIQMFMLSKPATVSQLRGLSPVFWHKTVTGKYIYRAGLFRTYNDVLSNLNKVKKAGFKTAFIVAFKDGEEIPVKKARGMEGYVNSSYRVQVSGD